MLRKARIEMGGALHHLIIRGVDPEFGGWKKVSGSMASGVGVKGEGRILGEGDFVMAILKVPREGMERRYRLRAVGFTLERLEGRVTGILGMEVEDIGIVGQICPERGVFCYWAVRELGMRETGVAGRLKLTQPAVYISVRREKHIAKEEGFDIPAE